MLVEYFFCVLQLGQIVVSYNLNDLSIFTLFYPQVCLFFVVVIVVLGFFKVFKTKLDFMTLLWIFKALTKYSSYQELQLLYHLV